MPRAGRRISSTGFYHVIAKGINHEKIFNQIREKNYIKKLLKKHSEKYDIEIYAYCIMSTHIHLIIHSPIQELSAYMAVVLSEYAIYYNYKRDRNGHVFQNRFKSECIEDEKYFWNCLYYIHLNPVKANIVDSVTKYSFSSIHEYKNEIPDIIHEKAISRYKNNFDSFNNYLIVHNSINHHIYLDVDEDIWFQKQSAAFSILNQIVNQKKDVTLREIIEQKQYRTELKIQLKTVLHCTKKEVEELFFMLKDSIIKKH